MKEKRKCVRRRSHIADVGFLFIFIKNNNKKVPKKMK